MEDFVTFEITNKLKEKGFNWKVNAYYGKHKNIFEVHPAMDMNDCEYRCSAPTISQVLKWLREEKQLHIDVGIYQDSSRDADGCIIETWSFWCYDIQNTLNGDLIYDFANTFDTIEFETYKEAVLHGINYVLNNLI